MATVVVYWLQPVMLGVIMIGEIQNPDAILMQMIVLLKL